MSVTFAQARAQMEAARNALPTIVREARDLAGAEAVERVRAEWPVGETGDSRDAWEFDGDALRNDLPYVSYVHDSLADQVGPEALRAAEPTFHDHVQRRIAALTSG